MVKISQEQLKKCAAVLDEMEKYRTLSTEEREMIVKSILSSEYLDLRCDWAFKYVMQNLDILKMLLNDFLPEKIKTIAKVMLSDGLSPEKISLYTGLSVEEIEALM